MINPRDFLDEHRADLVADLTAWVRVPSVSAEPEHAVDVLRSANWLSAALRDLGFPTVEIWAPDKAPAVYAEWCPVPGAPTVLIYSHHDVRSVKEADWEETAPFEPVLRDGYLYGRGASDAKGQVVAHLWGLRAYLAAVGGTPELNLKVLVEGEEEMGSAELAGLLDEHRPTADLVLFSDTMLWHKDHPAICTSLRGMINAELEIQGPDRDVHGGLVSGASINPIAELSRVLSLLHDDKGRVTVPGFYDGAEPPDDYAGLSYSEADWLTRSETRGVQGEAGYTVPQRLWGRPSLEVLTVVAGDPVGPSRGAVPSIANASMSIHTVPGQDTIAVGHQLKRWMAETVDSRYGHELTVVEKTSSDAYRTPADLPALALLDEAMAEAFGGPVARMGNAGSGPADLLARELDAPLVFFGTGLPEDHWHDSEERASIDVLLAGAATLAGFWQRLGSGNGS